LRVSRYYCQGGEVVELGGGAILVFDI
jgi:hypothetical protein